MTQPAPVGTPPVACLRWGRLAEESVARFERELARQKSGTYGDVPPPGGAAQKSDGSGEPSLPIIASAKDV
ncbi:MAG: hypothetical protein WCS31_19045 [Verrucomicrobiae bacterium]